MAVCLTKPTDYFTPYRPDYHLPAPAPVLMLPMLASPPNIPPAKPKKVKLEKNPPRKWNGKIRLYWQEFGDKDDRIIEIHDPETYAVLEILHGVYELEQFEKWNNHPEWENLYTDIMQKAENYVNRIKRLYKLAADKWDWDWITE